MAFKTKWKPMVFFSFSSLEKWFLFPSNRIDQWNSQSLLQWFHLKSCNEVQLTFMPPKVVTIWMESTIHIFFYESYQKNLRTFFHTGNLEIFWSDKFFICRENILRKLVIEGSKFFRHLAGFFPIKITDIPARKLLVHESCHALAI